MVSVKVTGLDRFTAALVRCADQIAAAHSTARQLAPEARWRRADLLWPGFGSPSNQG